MRHPTRPGVRYSLAALAAVLFSLLYLQVCAQVGRLSRDLQYDDVGYALDAAGRFDAAMAGGVADALETFVSAPPHSFLPSVQGWAAFSLLGVHDAALYASNAWLLVALALLLTFALRHRPAAVSVVAVAFALSSPLAYFAIAEFRPDIALGFTTALMVWFLLDAGFREDGRMLRWAGIMLAASLVVKSTFFAHTLAIALGLGVAALGATWAARFGGMPRFRLGARQVALFLAIGVALAVPFYLVNGVHVLDYFWSNTAGAKGQVWNYDRSLGWSEVFTRFRPLIFALGRLQSEAAALAATAFAIVLWRRGDRSAAVRIVALLAVAAVSAAIIVLGRQPSQFFFATMHWLVLFAAVFGYAQFQDGLAGRVRRVTTAAAALCVLGLAVANSELHDVAWPPGAEHGRSWNERIVALISADLRETPLVAAPVPNVLVFTATAVNPDTLKWVGRLAGQPLAAPTVHLLADLEEAKRLAAAFDYVVVPNRTLMPLDGWLPVAQLQQPIVGWMMADDRFEPLLPVDSSQRYYVFANRANTPRFHAQALVQVDGAVASFDHLRGEEGPYPLLTPPLPRLRWIEGREGAVCMDLAGGGPRDVVVGYWSRTPGKLTLLQDDVPLATVTLANEAFGEIRARYTPRAVRTCLRFVIDAPPNEPPLYVLVTRFEVTAAK